MFISKSLERIADHATNIAEEMVFLSKASTSATATSQSRTRCPCRLEPAGLRVD